MKYELKSLEWDTDYFGVNSARINLFDPLSESEQLIILEYCRNYEFITIANIDNNTENNFWIGTKTNAFLTDLNVQFIKVLDPNFFYLDERIYISNNMSRDEKIVDIAQKSFSYSRFVHDKKLHLEKATQIYKHWTENSFNQLDKFFVIAKNQHEIIGYILFNTKDECCFIELIAVDQKYRGYGVGKTMIYALQSYLTKLKISKIQVGTQINNIIAINFYINMGFKLSNCTSVYHMWNK